MGVMFEPLCESKPAEERILNQTAQAIDKSFLIENLSMAPTYCPYSPYSACTEVNSVPLLLQGIGPSPVGYQGCIRKSAPAVPFLTCVMA